MADPIEFRVVGQIERGSVLLLTEAPDFGDEGERHAELVAGLAKLAGHHDFVVLIASPGDTLEMADEDMMRRAGWVRA